MKIQNDFSLTRHKLAVCELSPLAKMHKLPSNVQEF